MLYIFALVLLPEQVWGSLWLPISTIREHPFSSSGMKHSDEPWDEEELVSIAENVSFRCWLSWNCILQIFSSWWLFFLSGVSPTKSGSLCPASVLKICCFSSRLAVIVREDFSMRLLLLLCIATSSMWLLYVGLEGLELSNTKLFCSVMFLGLLPKILL